MRTNIDVDDELLAEVMRITGAKTKKQAVEESLRDRIRRRDAAKAILDLRGKIEWEGDLDAMRGRK
jgi:Arc/MetJ family transcription regulator